MTVQNVFNQYASEYDSARRRLIPCFDDFYQTVVDVVPFANDEKLAVLDLGAGTGLLTAMLAAKYPQAHFTLLDIADKMLDRAARRLSGYGGRCKFSVCDYADPDNIVGKYDLVVSGLSIHHLENRSKKEIFRTIYSHLKPGGIFVNADQVLGETPEIDTVYRRKWLAMVKGLGCDDRELEAASQRMKEDKMSTLSHQLEALAAIGYQQVNCWFKHYSFVVYSGLKSAVKS